MVTDVVACWVLALPAIVASYVGYAVIEDLIRKRRHPPKLIEPRPPVSPPLLKKAVPETGWPVTVHGYDSPELMRRDVLLHIRHLENEAAKHEQNIQAILTEMRQRAERS